MDPPKGHHQRTHRPEQAFAEMKQDPIATPQAMPKTTQEFKEPVISGRILHPRTGDAPVKTPDDDHEQG